MSLLEWRMQLHANLTDHDFIQDPDDIPGGCLVCWERLGEEADRELRLRDV